MQNEFRYLTNSQSATDRQTDRQTDGQTEPLLATAWPNDPHKYMNFLHRSVLELHVVCTTVG